MGKRIDAKPQGAGLKIGIAISRFNLSITHKLLESALERLQHLGVQKEDIDVVWVPGAFELPQAVRALAQTGRYDGIVPLGCVIRGETPHFEYICQSVTMALAKLALESNTPIVFGVLTTNTDEQAAKRAGSNANKGAEAAESLIELIHAIRRLKK